MNSALAHQVYFLSKNFSRSLFFQPLILSLLFVPKSIFHEDILYLLAWILPLISASLVAENLVRNRSFLQTLPLSMTSLKIALMFWVCLVSVLHFLAFFMLLGIPEPKLISFWPLLLTASLSGLILGEKLGAFGGTLAGMVPIILTSNPVQGIASDLATQTGYILLLIVLAAVFCGPSFFVALTSFVSLNQAEMKKQNWAILIFSLVLASILCSPLMFELQTVMGRILNTQSLYPDQSMLVNSVWLPQSYFIEVAFVIVLPLVLILSLVVGVFTGGCIRDAQAKEGQILPFSEYLYLKMTLLRLGQVFVLPLMLALVFGSLGLEARDGSDIVFLICVSSILALVCPKNYGRFFLRVSLAALCFYLIFKGAHEFKLSHYWNLLLDYNPRSGWFGLGMVLSLQCFVFAIGLSLALVCQKPLQALMLGFLGTGLTFWSWNAHLGAVIPSVQQIILGVFSLWCLSFLQFRQKSMLPMVLISLPLVYLGLRIFLEVLNPDPAIRYSSLIFVNQAGQSGRSDYSSLFGIQNSMILKQERRMSSLPDVCEYPKPLKDQNLWNLDLCADSKGVRAIYLSKGTQTDRFILGGFNVPERNQALAKDKKSGLAEFTLLGFNPATGNVYLQWSIWGDHSFFFVRKQGSPFLERANQADYYQEYGRFWVRTEWDRKKQESINVLGSFLGSNWRISFPSEALFSQDPSGVAIYTKNQKQWQKTLVSETMQILSTEALNWTSQASVRLFGSSVVAFEIEGSGAEQRQILITDSGKREFVHQITSNRFDSQSFPVTLHAFCPYVLYDQTIYLRQKEGGFTGQKLGVSEHAGLGLPLSGPCAQLVIEDHMSGEFRLIEIGKENQK